MHATRTLILVAVLVLMGDGISTKHPVVVVPDDTEATVTSAPAALDPAALLPPPTEADAEGAARWLTE